MKKMQFQIQINWWTRHSVLLKLSIQLQNNDNNGRQALNILLINVALICVVIIQAETECYGIDMEGPVHFSSSSGNPLEIPQIVCSLRDQDLTEMHEHTNPLSNSHCFGIDLYIRTVYLGTEPCHSVQNIQVHFKAAIFSVTNLITGLSLVCNQFFLLALNHCSDLPSMTHLSGYYLNVVYQTIWQNFFFAFSRRAVKPLMDS